MSATASVRLFVALDAPEEVCLELAGWARRALKDVAARAGAKPALRLLAPQLMHMTLCFLGDTPTGEIAPIATALQAIEPEPIGALSLGAPVWLPPRHPRTLAVEVHDDGGGLATLRSDVVRALTSACGFEPERRRFRAHMTVARMGRGWARDPGTSGERRLAATPSISFTPEALVLYRSLLAPEGARYEPLATRALS